MDYERDLVEVELWEESLRRSLERRNRPRRSSVELHHLRPARDLSLVDVIERSEQYSRLRRRATERPAMPRPSLAVGGISAVALAAGMTVPKLLGGGAGKERAALVVDVVHPQTSPRSVSRHSQRVQTPRSTSPRLRRVPPPTAVRPAQNAEQAGAGSYAALPERATMTPATPQPTPDPVATIATVATAHPSGGVALVATPRKHVATTKTQPAKPAQPTKPAQLTTPAQPTRTTRPTTHQATTIVSPSSGGVAIPTNRTTTAPSTPTTAPPAGSTGYVNPLAHARVTPERIDQGVDYSGSGTLTALGDGTVTYVGTSGTGWPGAFIEYKLTDGADAGRYVYYAETIAPAAGLRVGESVRAGQAIASISGGIEIGWGADIGTETYAMQHGQWSSSDDARNVATAAGKGFSALIASLGGPPGKVEG